MLHAHYAEQSLQKKLCEDMLRVSCKNHIPDETKTRNIFKLSKSLTEQIEETAYDIFTQKIFPTIREGIIKETIRFDKVLILYANEMCYKYRSQHHYSMIRNRLEFMAKFLLAMKKKESKIEGYSES